MQLAIFLLALLNVIHTQRVKRQWGPSDFYQFEQWVNYVNRPRQPQFSVDNSRWGMPQYPAGNRNVQPHAAPNGWQLEQNPHWMNGYRQMAGFPQTRSRPPVVIETNVYRTNSRVPVPLSPPSGYGLPPQLMGGRGFQPTTSTSTTTTTTTTTTPTTTEDESERFIQTAVKEDIDNVSLVLPTTEEFYTTTHTTTEATTTTSPEQVDLEASMNTRATTLETTTTAEFASSDYNSVWTEGEPSSTFISVESTTSEKPDTTTTPPEESSTSNPVTEAPVDISTTLDTLETSSSQRNIIPEAEESSGAEAFVTGATLPSSTDADTLLSEFSNNFQADMGLRPPPLPIDILKRFHELGVSIEPTRS